LGVNAGYGMDSYDNSMKASATVSAPAPVGTQTGSVSSAVTMSRTNMFVGASLNLFLFRIVGEYGIISGGDDIATTNKFGEGTAAGRSYYSVGLRVKF
ncbi:MAG: hypothetical protein K2X99_04550, partial [Gemmatimonadaceae bacterium]|nr:hypothetical protein [Gemmatimonadaceae bacterium]